MSDGPYFDGDDWDGMYDDDWCEECGGEGFVEYMDCPLVWGEDCPSEVNHLVTCPYCDGTGRVT